MIFGTRIPLEFQKEVEDKLFEATEVTKQVEATGAKKETEHEKALIGEKKEYKQCGLHLFLDLPLISSV